MVSLQVQSNSSSYLCFSLFRLKNAHSYYSFDRKKSEVLVGVRIRFSERMIYDSYHFCLIFVEKFLTSSLSFEKKLLIFLLIFDTKSPDQLLICLEKLLISKIWIWQPWSTSKTFARTSETMPPSERNQPTAKES